MARLPKGKTAILRGILGPVTGIVSNIVIQKNGVIRITKSSKSNRTGS